MNSYDYEAVKPIWNRGASEWAIWLEENRNVGSHISINIGAVDVEEDLSQFDFGGCALSFEGSRFSRGDVLKNLTGVGSLTARDIYFFPALSFAEGAVIGRLNLSDIEKMAGFTLQKVGLLNSVYLTNIGITGDLNVQEQDFTSDDHRGIPTFQFSNVRVDQDVYIGEVNMPGNFGFYDCKFADQFTCTQSTFRLPLVLERCRFESLVNFTDSKFQYPPNIRGSVLHGSAIWPEESAFGVNIRTPLKRAVENVDACVSLRTEAASKGNMRNKKMFSILEQRYRILAKQIPLFDKIIFYSYGLMSNFGRSVARTVFSMIVIAVVFGAIYFLIECPAALRGQSIDWTVFADNLHESIKNTFLPAKTLFSQTNSLAETIAKIGHTILSGILFAQLFMSTRWALNAT